MTQDKYMMSKEMFESITKDLTPKEKEKIEKLVKQV